MTQRSFSQWCFFMISPEDSQRRSFNLELSVRMPKIASFFKSLFWIIIPVVLIIGIDWLNSKF